MAVHRAKPLDIPDDAILLSKEEAINHQIKTLHAWENWKDVFFFKYGVGILGGTVALSSIYINSYYRSKLKLGTYGKGSSYLAIAVIPSGLAMVFHHMLVVPDIVLQETCAVCVEMRAAAIQGCVAAVLPVILAPVSGFSNALNYGTYNVPYIQEPLKVLALWRKLTKPMGNIFFALFLAHALLASGITLLESKCVDTVNTKLDLLNYSVLID